MYILKDKMLSECGITSSDRVLIALSGGADSVALLLEMNRLKKEGAVQAIAAAHLHHGIRGAEADADLEFCEALTKSLSVPFFSKQVNIPFIAAQKQVSIETAARDARYAFLSDTCHSLGYTCIATAHHKDDQAETVLMHLIRGTGTDGMSGMKPRSGIIVRPFLGISKSDLLEYLSEHNQAYRTDSTNQDEAYLRNRIRHTVLPCLKKLNPGITDTLSNTAKEALQDSLFLNAYAEKAFCDVKDRSQIAKLPMAVRMRVLKRYLPYDSFERADLETLDSLLKSETGTVRNLKQGYIAWVSSDMLFVQRPNTVSFSKKLPLSADTPVPGGWISAELTKRSGLVLNSGFIFINPDSVKGDLTVRSPKKGDRFQPYGMTGTKLLSDYFTDRKVPRFSRTVPLICDDAGILGIVGFTIDDRAKITDTTEMVIKISYKEGTENVG